MSYTAATVQLLSPEGVLVENDLSAPYLPLLADLSDERLREMHRHMVVTRRFDVEATNLQRQGQLALWVPSMGQEGAQVGSAVAARPQDHIFPSYREHLVGKVRGLDLLNVMRLLRGVTQGGWNPEATNNFHIYTLVLGVQTLHATGFAMGMNLDGRSGTGDPEKDAAVMVYLGDGATSQGDANEAMVFSASYQAPVVFFLQNNHWAISVPVSVQSRTPLYLRAQGFGIPSVQIDGNDPLASYAVTRENLEASRVGGGPRYIEAVTYRMGAHTTSDDPTKYRSTDEVDPWARRDPILRFEAFLRSRGADDGFFAEVREEAEDFASDIRTRTLTLENPPAAAIFDHVYSEPHPLVDEQKQWLADYEAALGAAE
ncbi:pyruvate dehydrogenase (acetyl-transferring) E1 component subunit alpha [soil metagenome]